MSNMTSTRSVREKAASDESDVYEQWHKQRSRFQHIFESPNTKNAERTYVTILQEGVSGKRVLEIGCGTGGNASRLSSFGATYVLAVDISEKRIAEAQQYALPGKLEYAVADVSVPLDGVFDVIVGKAVLHHLDYQEVLPRLYRENLTQNGLIIFYEPLAGNGLMRLFRHWSHQAHTSDEHPFDPQDLRWLSKTFPQFTMIPVNYLSLPLGVLSSFLFASADNVLLRIADAIDRFLARHASWLHTHFRCGIFIIRKP